jgi:signal transduction histidine kinase
MQACCRLAWTSTLGLRGTTLAKVDLCSLPASKCQVQRFSLANRNVPRQADRTQRRTRAFTTRGDELAETLDCDQRIASKNRINAVQRKEWLMETSADDSGAVRRKGRKGRPRARQTSSEAHSETSDGALRQDQPVDTAEQRPKERSVRSTGAESTLPQCSREFLQLCRAQFEVLASLLGATQCALCVRREAPDGSLEFVPLCVHPEAQAVWVVGAAPGSRPLAGPAALPGGVAAGQLLPEYPFIDLNDDAASELADGGLSAPLLDGNTVVGMLAVWRVWNQEHSHGQHIRDVAHGRWSEDESKQLVSIAKTLALAFVLDQRHRQQQSTPAVARNRKHTSPASTNNDHPPMPRAKSLRTASRKTELEKPPTKGTRTAANHQPPVNVASPADLSESMAVWIEERSQLPYRENADAHRARESAMLAQVRDILSSILHQARSPISALRTFGKLLLRRLPPGDLNRDLARDIIVQCERLNELLSPLDTVTQRVAQLPPAVDMDSMSKDPEANQPRSWPMRTAAVDAAGKAKAWLAPRSYLPASASPLPPLEAPMNERNRQNTKTTPLLRPSTGEIQYGRLHLCWMNDVVRPLLGTAVALAMEHGVELRGRLDHVPAILADGFALREAISNVLENAIKYTGMVRPGRSGRLVYLWIQLISLVRPKRALAPGEQSMLSADQSHVAPMNEEPERDDQAVALFVGDTGPGIPRRELKRVWERGYRGRQALSRVSASPLLLSPGHETETNDDQIVRMNPLPTITNDATALTTSSSESDSAPHGLGLYLTRQLVESMGGMVILQSPWPQPERAHQPPGVSGTETALDWMTGALPQCSPPVDQMNVYVKAPSRARVDPNSRRAHQRGTLVGIVFQRAITAER